MANMRLVRLVGMISLPSVLSAKAVVDPIDNRRHRAFCAGNEEALKYSVI